jgi:hypothetical protein
MIRLLDIKNGKVVPTEHCRIITWLKDVIDEFPDEKVHINIFAYIFYMTCPNQENPYFNVVEEDKKGIILKSIKNNFDPENEKIITAIKEAEKLYETPTHRAYISFKIAFDNISEYMRKTKVNEKNINAIMAASRNFEAQRKTFKNISIDLESEQTTRVRGGRSLSYDQMQ